MVQEELVTKDISIIGILYFPGNRGEGFNEGDWNGGEQQLTSGGKSKKKRRLDIIFVQKYRNKKTLQKKLILAIFIVQFSNKW